MLAGLFGGALHASTVISCAWATSGPNNCVTAGLPNFQTQLDWAAFGTPSGAVNTGLWTNNMGKFTVTVSEQSPGVGEGARTADDFGSVKSGGIWYATNQSPDPAPFAFVGHFNSITDNQPSSPLAPDSPYGDHLMGLVGNGTTNASRALVISFGNTDITDLAFRIAATTTTSFTSSFSLYSGVNGTGTLLATFNSGSLSGGGTCAGLVSVSHAAPVPCNDAMMLMATGYSGIQSVVIKTNDPNGFYVGDIFVSSVPEPSTLVFGACGVVLLFLGRKRFRKV
jgi:hypothetical protein